MTFQFWTGPCAVDQVANYLQTHGFFNVRAGTENVYFRLTPGHHPDTVEEAQVQITSCYPFAGYRVHVCSKD